MKYKGGIRKTGKTTHSKESDCHTCLRLGKLMSMEGSDRLRGAGDSCAPKTIPATQELRQENFLNTVVETLSQKPNHQKQYKNNGK